MLREHILIPLTLNLTFAALVMTCYFGFEASMGRPHGPSPWLLFGLSYAVGQAVIAAVLLLICVAALIRRNNGMLFASSVTTCAGIAFWLLQV